MKLDVEIILTDARHLGDHEYFLGLFEDVDHWLGNLVDGGLAGSFIIADIAERLDLEPVAVAQGGLDRETDHAVQRFAAQLLELVQLFAALSQIGELLEDTCRFRP